MHNYALTVEELIILLSSIGEEEAAKDYYTLFRVEISTEDEANAALAAVTKSLIARNYIVDLDNDRYIIDRQLEETLRIFCNVKHSVRLSRHEGEAEDAFVIHENSGRFIGHTVDEFIQSFYFFETKEDAIDKAMEYLNVDSPGELQLDTKFPLSGDLLELFENDEEETDLETLKVRVESYGVPAELSEAFIIDYATAEQIQTVADVYYDGYKPLADYAFLNIIGSNNSWILENNEEKFSLQVKTETVLRSHVQRLIEKAQ